MPADDEIRLPINRDADLVVARAKARALAQSLHFSRPDPTLIATAVSEVARNVLIYAERGEILLRPLRQVHRYGLLVVVRDEGPGIADVDAILRDGYALGGSLGLGLPGARRLMDDFRIDSRPGAGTIVTMRKWRSRDELEMLRERRAQQA